MTQPEQCASSFARYTSTTMQDRAAGQFSFLNQNFDDAGRSLAFDHGTGSGFVAESKKSFGIPMRDPRQKRDNGIACEVVCHESSSVL